MKTLTDMEKKEVGQVKQALGNIITKQELASILQSLKMNLSDVLPTSEPKGKLGVVSMADYDGHGGYNVAAREHNQRIDQIAEKYGIEL